MKTNSIIKAIITFKKMTQEDMPLFLLWAKKPHVKDIWFADGYESIEKYYQKIDGNGYDYGFIIYLDDKPIGYIQCSDLYAYRTKCSAPKGLFTNEDPGTFCLDLFIGEEDFLNKGYGTEIVKSFVTKVFAEFNAKKILIDPACSNKQAIRCYEKSGFKVLRKANDGVNECYIMEFEKQSKIPDEKTIRLINLKEIDDKKFAFRGVECVVLTHDNKILLQQRDDNWQRFPGYLANFGGQIELNEIPMQALIRELYEELGAKVNEVDVITLGTITEAATNYKDLIYVYFWHDKNNTITGCYEGMTKYYDNVQDVFDYPKVMGSVQWALKECLLRNLLKNT